MTSRAALRLGLTAALVAIGLHGAITQRNLVRQIMALNVMGSGAFLVLAAIPFAREALDVPVFVAREPQEPAGRRVFLADLLSALFGDFVFGGSELVAVSGAVDVDDPSGMEVTVVPGAM